MKMMSRSSLCLLLPLLILVCGVVSGCRSKPDVKRDRADVDAVLDDWHRAASEADEIRYIGHMTTDGVFLGTDATERWNTSEFREFVHPYFSKGKGWTYEPKRRHVIFSKYGDTAWFDERLFNDKYGELRGTGVLVNIQGIWKISHYNMSFPLPNDLTKKIVQMIQAGGIVPQAQ